MTKITVIFTCFNRKEKTLCCMKSLLEGNKNLEFGFVILDDNSADGTPEQLTQLQQEGWDITLLHGDGNSFWAGGMRKAIACAKKHTDTDYYLMVNDDVEFYPMVIEKMVEEAERFREKNGKAEALVGPMCDRTGKFSYGGIRYQKGIHYAEIGPESENRSCDSFNMNCLLLEKETFLAVPNFDEHYIHTLADFDYGLCMKRMGIPMQVVDFYAGVCPDNDPKGGWSDRNLTRRERLKKKESVKGAPFGPWFYFLRKNFGIGQALVHSITPYVRILLGR